MKDRDSFTWKQFRALPFRKKIEHIREYYIWYIVGGAAALCLLISLITSIAGNRKDVLISGIFINNSTNQAGYAYLQEDYWTYCGSDDNTRVDLQQPVYLNFASETGSEYEASSFMLVTTMIAARTLDYIVTDEASLSYYWGQEIPLDLRLVLPEETLARCSLIEQDGIPIAIRLDDTYFAKTYPLAADTSCIFIVASSQDYEKDARFLQYLLEN